MTVDCEMHDRMVALYSHLPQLASTALASAVAGQGAHLPGLLSGPGLVDMTRLALSSYDLWRDILATNSEPIERALALTFKNWSTCAKICARVFSKRIRERRQTGGQRSRFRIAINYP